MKTQTPTLCCDTVFDRVMLYPAATLSASSAQPDREPWRVADHRRERTYWSPTTDGGGSDHWLLVDLGLGAARAVDYLWLDRGHNLHGRTVVLEGGDDGVTFPSARTFTVPAVGTLGGDAVSGDGVLSATEEGAHYAFFARTAPRRYWRLRIPAVAAFIPVVTGLMAGLRAQFLGYSAIYDEDAGERTVRQEQAPTGYRAMDRVYAWRTLELDLKHIGAREYDETVRTLRRQLFELNQPALAVLDYATHPERMWLFQLEGTTWGMPKQRIYRGGRLRFREVGHRLSL